MCIKAIVCRLVSILLVSIVILCGCAGPLSTTNNHSVYSFDDFVDDFLEPGSKLLISEFLHRLDLAPETISVLKEWFGVAKSRQVRAEIPKDAKISQDPFSDEPTFSVYPVIFTISGIHSDQIVDSLYHAVEFKYSGRSWVLTDIVPKGTKPGNEDSFVDENPPSTISPSHINLRDELEGALEQFRVGWMFFINRQQDIGILLDSYSEESISVRRWAQHGSVFTPSPEIRSVDKLYERMLQKSNPGDSLSVQFSSVQYYSIDSGGHAGTSCIQYYDRIPKGGGVGYHDVGYKILSWRRENDRWKIYRERWYPARRRIDTDSDLRTKWFLNNTEIDALKRVKLRN